MVQASSPLPPILGAIPQVSPQPSPLTRREGRPEVVEDLLLFRHHLLLLLLASHGLAGRL